MASDAASEEPLSTLYLQIEYAESPSAALGVASDATDAEIREAYRALALRIHPDKAPSEKLRELHTSLFQHVQVAYTEFLRELGQPGDDGPAAPKRLPETEASLHARNVAFREALSRERERALNAKHAADARQAAKLASLKAKNERLADKRILRTQTLERERQKRDQEIAKRDQQTAQRLDRTMEKTEQSSETLGTAPNEPPLDWDQEEDRLALEAENQQTSAITTKTSDKPTPAKRAVQNRPTAATARPLWDDTVDERLVSDAEIKGRWNKSLLSGGRAGSVSLSQKKQREHSGAARSHKVTMVLTQEADHMIKRALTGNRTYSAMAEEELLEEAFVGTEARATKKTDRFLQLMGRDGLEQHLLEAGAEGCEVALESLKITRD